MTPDHLDHLCGRKVSRETYEDLSAFTGILTKWNDRINLISRSTISDVWTRHIVDSIQVFDLSDAASDHWADLGAGGGFPGIVAAIMAKEAVPGRRFSFVESDQRKSAFLSTVVRELGLNAEIRTDRIENTLPLNADILSARALAPLPQLLVFAGRHLAPTGIAFLPKGANYQAEIDEALESFRFDLQKHPSKTDPQAVILAIKGISRV